MVRLNTIVLATLLVFSQAYKFEIGDQAFGENYEGLHDYFEGLVKGFRDNSAEISEDCLSAANQAKLNQDTVAFLGVITGINRSVKWHESLQILMDDYRQVSVDCGLQDIADSFDKAIKTDGVMKVMFNFAQHFNNIEKDIVESFKKLEKKHYSDAGKLLGECIALVIPPEPLVRLFEVEASPSDAIEFLKGFTMGIRKDQDNEEGACYTDIMTFLNDLSKCATDVVKIANGQMIAITDLLADIKTLRTNAEGDYKDCNVAKLVKLFQELLGPNGMTILYQNYFTNMSAINDAIKEISTGKTDFKEAGFDYGVIAKLILGFDIEQESFSGQNVFQFG